MKEPKSQSEPENVEKSISKEHEEDEVEDKLPIDSDADDEDWSEDNGTLSELGSEQSDFSEDEGVINSSDERDSSDDVGADPGGYNDGQQNHNESEQSHQGVEESDSSEDEVSQHAEVLQSFAALHYQTQHSRDIHLPPCIIYKATRHSPDYINLH